MSPHATKRATERLCMTLTPELEEKIVTAIRTGKRAFPVPSEDREYTSVYLYKPSSHRQGYFVVYAKNTGAIASVFPRAWKPKWVTR